MASSGRFCDSTTTGAVYRNSLKIKALPAVVEESHGLAWFWQETEREGRPSEIPVGRYRGILCKGR